MQLRLQFMWRPRTGTLQAQPWQLWAWQSSLSNLTPREGDGGQFARVDLAQTARRVHWHLDSGVTTGFQIKAYPILKAESTPHALSPPDASHPDP
jgi:hypothetical protein